MFEIISGIASQFWLLLAESSPYVLFGFFAAGLLKGLIPDEMVVRHLGKNSFRSVLKASLLGIPLPLCSCGVIPAAVGLRKQGASRGASAAFLVSTPESGVDSIAITYALLDPIMTVVRPVAAFFTATVTGLLINRIPEEVPHREASTAAAGCGFASGCDNETNPSTRPPLTARVREGLCYAFGEMLKDIGRWLLLGIAIASLIAYLVPDDFFARYLGSEAISLLIMLLVGIPLYICASASTPIAAALVLKGISPGAALVFLLAGPATNAATVTIVGKFWGKRATGIYLASIAACSIAFGWLVNRLYAVTGIDISTWVQKACDSGSSAILNISAILLLTLIGLSYLPKKKGSDCGCSATCS